MGMTKTNVEDRTIRPASEARMVGDVTSISISDTAKSGADSPDISNEAPFIMANPGFEDGKGQNDYIPSVEGDANRAAAPFSAPNAPDESLGSRDESSVNSGPYGERVNWPAAADGTSAGGAKSTTSFINDAKGITGAKVSFPAGSDKMSAGSSMKDVKSFVPSGADWK